MVQIDGRCVLHLPTKALMFEVSRWHLFAVRPHSAVSESRRKLKRKALAQTRNPALKKPGLLGHIGMNPLLILISHHAFRIASWSIRSSDLVVGKEVALAGIADLDHLVILDGILMPVGSDAPDV